ncbi:MAG: hypothetical protein QF921_13120 [Pseudomonadales bacterium]|jgi:hypothetical protein|nr:hypothetical protein [Pseudomonadales bacterium]MDP6469786.1 hypothetical protein [Pseudomonadales bacterium]MDP6827611.1 hypothetical protein [Pseudomonadales bacterium]MDP6972430.1 hypothetical protein [Pseudomonadales bacterium]|tara:strand:- start:3824 stop:4834 length:1011 start_codon:yes stop_codon:yes gene_type:complete
MKTLMLTTLLLSCGMLYTADSDWTMPRTPDGRPDFNGVWANNAATPLERPDALADKVELTQAEVAELQENADRIFSGEKDAAFGDDVFEAALVGEDDPESYDPETGNYDDFWVVRRTFENRTSLIVDPANGKLPPLTEEGAARKAAYEARVAEHPADSYTDRINSDRCITYGVPFVYAGYNGYFQIVQTAEHVLIAQEMIHETRVIPVDERPPLTEDIRQWTGSPGGYWEGDSLVVNTRNFSPKSMFLDARGNLELSERYTLIGPGTLEWRVTVSDDTTWSVPWTAVVYLKKTNEDIFEYACHEGNYAMEGILAGAREKERQAKQADMANAGGGSE